MRRLTHGLLWIAAIFLVATVAACGHSGAGGALSSLTPSRPTVSRPDTPAVSAQPTTSAAASPPATTAAPTQPPTTPANAPQPGISTQAPASGSSSPAVWVWILIAAVVIVGAVVWIVLAGRRRSTASATSAAWSSRVIDAYARGAALHDAMTVAETPGAFLAADAGARWSDIQRRADDLAQELYALREAAPDEPTRARVADVLATLHAVRSAMDAERAPMGAGERQAEVVRGRLFNFESSLRALRTAGNPPPQ